MKKTLLVVIFLSIQVGFTQQKSKVENHTSKAMDLVVFTFSIMEPITIGTVASSGELTINFPKDISFISDEAKENSWSDTASTLFSKCDTSYDILSEEENGKAVPGGYISLSTKENPYAGLLYMVTDKNLIPWLEDSYSNNAVVGSYFELVYMESDFMYQGTCTATISRTENETIETLYTYDLELKPGFNFIAYEIESVMELEVPSGYEENKFEKVDKPRKIKVTSTQATPPNTEWIGKYF